MPLIRSEGLAARLPGLVRWWPWPLILVVLAYAYGPTVAQQVEFASEPLRFHDDARIQIPAYYRYSDPAPWDDDLLGDYVLDFYSYPLYHALFVAGATLWDAERLSKVLPFVLLLFTIAALMAAAHRLGGAGPALIAGALTLGTEAYLDRMAGGCGRAFAFPVLAGGVAALAFGSLNGLRVLIWIGAGTYPMAAVPLGMANALMLLVLPAADRGDAVLWPLRRRLQHLAITAGVAAVLVLPVVISSREYGRPITTADVAAYPEAGPGGTHGTEDRPPYHWYMVDAPRMIYQTLTGAGAPFLPEARRLPRADLVNILALVCTIAIAGWFRLASRSAPARRISMLLAGAVVAQTIALMLVPYFYHPERYIRFTVPPLITVIVAAGALGFFAEWSKLGRALVLAGGLLFLAVAGGRGDPWGRLVIEVGPKDAEVYRAIAKLPPEVLIAGWPDDPMSNVPYLSRRRCLMTGELHQALHTGYVEEARRRLSAFFAAYLAVSPEPIAALRDELGVTHLLVQLDHFEKVPGYMNPLGDQIKALTKHAEGRRYELMRQLDRMAIYRDARFAVVDLARLDQTTTAPPPGRVLRVGLPKVGTSSAASTPR